ncbi:unnamed protein product [Schistosoma rodhaini]|uniref:Uncharacterized protein n=1 Tax=Schistosoma rodhaini TaxID=6188 RepID=A0AA85FW54_9TREM|nr:unnamed protein product [Schistosoma rodhaini]
MHSTQAVMKCLVKVSIFSLKANGGKSTLCLSKDKALNTIIDGILPMSTMKLRDQPKEVQDDLTRSKYHSKSWMKIKYDHQKFHSYLDLITEYGIIIAELNRSPANQHNPVL